MAFTLRMPPEIHFGAGTARRGPEIAARFGSRVFRVTGSRGAGWKVTHEPDVALVDEGARLCREAKCDVVLAVGGGSVLDAAKAVSVLVTNGGSAIDYLEDVGNGRALERPGLPLVAVPTTAGSGSEATRNAVLRVPALGVKRSMRSDFLMPRVAIVDPELSGAAPRDVAASAGLDALTHLIEAYVSNGAQPTTDALALPGIRLAAQALVEGKPESMALASLWGGIALANAGLGAVHGLVAPLGGRCGVSHGFACAALLVETIDANRDAMRAREPANPALARYAEIEEALGGVALGPLRARLGVPALAKFGVSRRDIPGIVRDSRGSSMKYNPIVLTDGELERILLAAIER